ncbi:copper homeostasis protein [Anseongella ginsenosidimutans]|uniref:PF03932 family protein CutC n=1 Tax=Anseongella ginsenosidimutans TaxID=496056 RepID=A0A4R3KRP1_9SPHI|nr:copper homeostasis protein CutC [Anseongella ginsenosidimutans]QEC52955.1 copper homeostasis protein CutC [Anseongella ginsenosidimutans]TCS87354.1 copper homeostasis protein [Anseongella ginsenosidimutans]
MRPELEICCYSVDSVRAAACGGADRVELCASPPEGGITPSHATIELAREVRGIKLYVIIRPRGGDFCYSPLEFNIMKRDIEVAGNLGADGVVIGILQPDGHIDKARTRELVELARPMDITFHRAFDMSADPARALQDIYETGIRRVLSSGTRNTVDEGLPVLADLARRAGQGFGIMAGSGVKLHNLEALHRAGIRQFHSSASKTLPSAMQYRNPHIQMGKEGGVDEYAVSVADENLIRDMRRGLDQL